MGSNFDVSVQPGVYALLAILSDGKTADEGVASLQAEIAKLRDAPVSEAELEEARNELLAEALENRETSDGRAAELARSVILFGDPGASDKLLAQLQAVTAADVQRVAKSLLDDARSVTIRYLPEVAGAKGDVIASSTSIETVKIDIPVAEIPTNVLKAEADRTPPPPAGPAVAAVVPAASEKTLANGLRVIVANRPGLPLVAADLRFAAGSALDPSDRAGLASITADVATRGTTTRSATDIAREVESLGATLNATAGADSSSVSISTRSDKADALFAIFADVVRNAAFEEEELGRARQESLDGLTVALRQPGSVAQYALARRLFGDGPYGKTPSPRSVAALTRDDVVAFHATWWRPDNAVLVITGDVKPDVGFELAQQAFGSWEKPAKALPAATEPMQAGTARPLLLVDIPKIGQAAVLAGNYGPTRTSPDFFATLIANNVLGGGYSSRLNQEIRIKRGLSYGASSNFVSRKSSAPIVASAQTRNDAVAQVVELLSGELGRLGSALIPEAEITNRKAVLIGGFGRSVETVGGLASQLSTLAQFGLPLTKLQSYAADIEAVTPEQTAAAARNYFDPAKASFVVVGDAAVFGKALKAKYPKLEQIGIGKFNLDSATLK